MWSSFCPEGGAGGWDPPAKPSPFQGEGGWPKARRMRVRPWTLQTVFRSNAPSSGPAGHLPPCGGKVRLSKKPPRFCWDGDQPPPYRRGTAFSRGPASQTRPWNHLILWGATTRRAKPRRKLPLIRPCGPPSSLWGEGLALGQRPPLRRPNSAQNRAFFPLRPLTAGRKGDKMAPHRKKAVTGRSTRGPGPQRGAAWCKAPDGPAEGAREPRSGNAPPDRPRYGLRVRAHRARIQVVPRTVSVRPEPMARGVFVCLPLFLS